MIERIYGDKDGNQIFTTERYKDLCECGREVKQEMIGKVLEDGGTVDMLIGICGNCGSIYIAQFPHIEFK